VAAGQAWRCAVCRALLPAHFQIDHVLALRNGGGNRRDNYQALCANCHAAKSHWDGVPDRYTEWTHKSPFFYPGPLWTPRAETVPWLRGGNAF